MSHIMLLNYCSFSRWDHYLYFCCVMLCYFICLTCKVYFKCGTVWEINIHCRLGWSQGVRSSPDVLPAEVWYAYRTVISLCSPAFAHVCRSVSTGVGLITCAHPYAYVITQMAMWADDCMAAGSNYLNYMRMQKGELHTSVVELDFRWLILEWKTITCFLF